MPGAPGAKPASSGCPRKSYANQIFSYNAANGQVWDVVSGSNGSCGSTILCTSKAGYDGPTGIGTPKPTALTNTPNPTP